MTALFVRNSDIYGRWSVPKMLYWAATVLISLAMWWIILTVLGNAAELIR